MQKRWIIVAIALIIITNVLQGVFWFKNKAKTISKYEQEQAALVMQLEAYGSDTVCYTVKTSVKPGDQITMDNIETITYPSSYVTAQMVTNASDIYGKLFKVALVHGTPITYNMTMEDDIRADTRDYDIMLDSWPGGLEPGDYIDINITMPYGDRYIVVPYKRVYEVNENTLKVYLTAAELDTYIGACVDEALNEKYGATIFATRYVMPGLQDEAVAYYAVPTNIAALIQKNPNIIDKEELAKANQWRSSIEELLTIFRDSEDTVDTDGATLAEKRAQYNDAVMSDVNARREADAENGDSSVPDGEDEFSWEDTSQADVANKLEDTVNAADNAAGGAN